MSAPRCLLLAVGSRRIRARHAAATPGWRGAPVGSRPDPILEKTPLWALHAIPAASLAEPGAGADALESAALALCNPDRAPARLRFEPSNAWGSPVLLGVVDFYVGGVMPYPATRSMAARAGLLFGRAQAALAPWAAPLPEPESPAGRALASPVDESAFPWPDLLGDAQFSLGALAALEEFELRSGARASGSKAAPRI